jgi:predicted AAA+ superfamily ATPase
MRNIIRQKIVDALLSRPPTLTRRDAYIPNIPNKAIAVVGMRRSGKTWFLHQCRAERLAKGMPPESLLYFSFEDDRLSEMTSAQLGWVLEEYYIRCPQFRDRKRVTFFFDEIQVVPGWEAFVRRLLDTEKADIYVSGSINFSAGVRKHLPFPRHHRTPRRPKRECLTPFDAAIVRRPSQSIHRKQVL